MSLANNSIYGGKRMQNKSLFTKQFSIYEADLSDIGLGISPCIIIQNDVGNKYSPTTIIMPLVPQKLEKHYLYFKIFLKAFGEMYVLASFVKCISKSRLTTVQPLEIIDDKQIIEKIYQYYLANSGMKAIWISGKKEIVDLTESELSKLYIESAEC